jgi:hypothetical protein
MAVVELDPEDLGIVLIELELVLGFVPLPGLGVAFGRQVLVAVEIGAWVGALGSSNGGSGTVLVEAFGLDVGVEAMEGEGGDFEEGQEESEGDSER